MTGFRRVLFRSVLSNEFYVLAGNPQPNGTGADYQDIEFIAQDMVLHLSATERAASCASLIMSLDGLAVSHLRYLTSKQSRG